MATYIPNATQTTEPVESRTVESAALEFRTLKGSINSRIDTVQANLDAEEAARIAGDAAEEAARIAADLAEEAARIAADSAEATARIAADAAESAARIAGDSAEATARIAADSAEAAARIAGDANLQIQNNSQDVRIQAIEAALLAIGEGGLPGTVYVQRLSGTGVQTVFTLNVRVPTSALIDVFISGVYQNKNTFTVVDDILTFSEAPPAGTDNVEVVISITIANVETDASLVGYYPAGAGAVATSVQAKLREFVSIKDFGARSITETGYETFDSTAAIQAALNYVNSIGGGVVYIPPGRYRKADTSPTLVMYSNTTIRGAGDCSVIFHDDQPANPRRDLLIANNTSNIAFENFKIEGTLQSHTVETNQSQALTGIGINGFRMSGVTIQSVRYMATAFVYVRGGVVKDCRFIDVLRDGVRFTHSQDISIIGNVFKRVADDAVALHSLDTDSAIPPPAGVSNWGAVPTQSGLIVSGNTFEACQGIKILGAKVATVSGNTMRRMLRLPITVDSTINLPEGNTPVFCVSIVDNIITDTLLNFNTPDGGYAVRVKVRNRSKGALAAQPGYVSDVSLFNWNNNIDAPGAVSVGSWGITIARNTIATTLPVSGVAKYSDYGYGNLLDRQGGSFGPGFYDPTITSNFFSVFGIRFEGPVRGLLIESNTLSGGGVGVNAIDLTGYSASNGIDRETAIIRNNTITDWPGTGIAIGSDGNSSSVIVTGNWLDLDPLFRHPAHSSTENTWTNGAALVGLITAAGSYGVVEQNTFLHMSGVTGNIDGFSWGTNYVIYDPNGTIGLDGPANCRGVRAVPSSIKFVHLIYDGNPASATFKRIITTPKLSASAMPSSGTYVYGHVVQASVPTTLSPGAGQEYSIIGWQRITTGSGHILNVDWKQLRCLTGQ